MKIVINKCYGGFHLSDEAIELYFQICRENGETEMSINYGGSNISRSDPYLVETVEKMGKDASGNVGSSLIIKEVPDEYAEFGAYEIKEYDGRESLYLDKKKLAMGQLIKKLQAENEQLRADIQQMQVDITRSRNL